MNGADLIPLRRVFFRIARVPSPPSGASLRRHAVDRSGPFPAMPPGDTPGSRRSRGFAFINIRHARAHARMSERLAPHQQRDSGWSAEAPPPSRPSGTLCQTTAGLSAQPCRPPHECVRPRAHQRNAMRRISASSVGRSPTAARRSMRDCQDCRDCVVQPCSALHGEPVQVVRVPFERKTPLRQIAGGINTIEIPAKTRIKRAASSTSGGQASSSVRRS